MKTPRQVSSKPGSEFVRADRAAKFLLAKTRIRPRIGVVLGSGLGMFANELADSVRIEYKRIPNFPRSTAIGHAGRMVIGKLQQVPVAVMQGRVHLYEGYSAREAAFPIRVMARMGVRAVIVTNAAGGIQRDFNKGCLVVLRDHINLQGANPLTGMDEERFGPRFPDLTQAYWKQYRVMAIAHGKRLGIEMAEGVYAAVSGPNYETPAEIRYLRAIGADLVGMSTVPEVIAAAQHGVRVLGISCVTNMAAGILEEPITVEEVLETTERVKSDFVALLRSVIPGMDRDFPA